MVALLPVNVAQNAEAVAALALMKDAQALDVGSEQPSAAVTKARRHTFGDMIMVSGCGETEVDRVLHVLTPMGIYSHSTMSLLTDPSCAARVVDAVLEMSFPR